MSEKLLSQEEISALLGAVRGDPDSPQEEVEESPEAAETAEPETSGPETRTQAPPLFLGRRFPILKEEGLSEELGSAVRSLHGYLAQKAGASLSTLLRSHFQLRLDQVALSSYAGLLKEVPDNSSVWSLLLKDHDLRVVLYFEPGLAHAAVDLLMGGEGEPAPTGRSLSEMDQSIVESVVRILVREFTESWSRVLPFEGEIEGQATSPRLLQVFASGEELVTLVMTLKAGNTEGQLWWGLPTMILEPLRNKMERLEPPRLRDRKPGATLELETLVAKVPVRVEAEVATRGVPLRDLVELSEGDVFRLEHRVEDPVSVALNGCPRFAARVVACHDHKAIELETLTGG